jgi:hypothetical protein
MCSFDRRFINIFAYTHLSEPSEEILYTRGVGEICSVKGNVEKLKIIMCSGSLSHPHQTAISWNTFKFQFSSVSLTFNGHLICEQIGVNNFLENARGGKFCHF